jgi:AraC-like DNA-binding protein
MRRLGRDEWMAALATGTVRAGFVTAGHARFLAEWGHRRRVLGGVHVLYAVTSGGIRVRAGSIDAVAAPGAVVWVSAGCLHDLVPPERGVRVGAFMARVELCDRRGPLRPELDCVLAPPRAAQAEGFAELIREAASPGAWFAERLRARLLLLFADAESSRAAQQPRLSSRQEAAVRSRAAQAGPALRLPTAELARAARLSPPYFARRFAASFGCAPRAWLVAERLRHAAVQLLERDAPIGRIAEELGYADLFLFSRQFRRAFGCSPRRFRAR